MIPPIQWVVSVQFPHHGSSKTSDSRHAEEQRAPVLETQQARVLEALRSAAGAPVSYAELRARGVEFPASVVSELELAGVPIQRCRTGAGGLAGEISVRLEPEARPARTDAPNLAPGAAQLRAPLAGGRWLAPVAMVVAAFAVLAFVIAGLGGGGHSRRLAAGARGHPHRSVAAARKPAASVAGSPTARATATPTPTTPVSPALATELEATGHGLVAAGSYSTAAPVLRRALAATGESAADCLEPSSEACLTYAYALYDLGRALQLSGRPAAAVPILEQRLRIDNQRPVVQAELSVAQAELR